MKKDFAKIRERLGLAADVPLETLLAEVAQKLAASPDDIELAYLQAEILRKLERAPEASSRYQHVVQLSDQRSGQRHDSLARRLRNQRHRLGVRLLVYGVVLLLVLGAAFLLKENPERHEETNMAELAFVKWLAERQALQIVALLKEQYPDRVFKTDNNHDTQDPLDAMLAWINPSAAQKPPKPSGDKSGGEPAVVVIGGGSAGAEESSEKDQPAPFQCSVAPLMCRSEDVPTASGDARYEIGQIIFPYQIMLLREKNCQGLVKLADTFSKELQWRRDERDLKTYLEGYITDCFYDKKDYHQAVEHAGRIICSGFEPVGPFGYNRLTINMLKLGNTPEAHKMQTCAIEYADYLHNKQGDDINTAGVYREIGSIALQYFNDTKAYFNFGHKARNIIDRLLEENSLNRQILLHKTSIEKELLEAYIITGNHETEFVYTINSLNRNLTVSDSDRIIIGGLDAIRLMRNKDYNAAKNAVENLILKFQQVPEYVCGWNWDSFLKWLDSDNSPNLIGIKPKIKLVIDATECEVDTNDRLEKLQSLADWLASKASNN